MARRCATAWSGRIRSLQRRARPEVDLAFGAAGGSRRAGTGPPAPSYLALLVAHEGCSGHRTVIGSCTERERRTTTETSMLVGSGRTPRRSRSRRCPTSTSRLRRCPPTDGGWPTSPTKPVSTKSGSDRFPIYIWGAGGCLPGAAHSSRPGPTTVPSSSFRPTKRASRSRSRRRSRDNLESRGPCTSARGSRPTP